MRAGYSLNNAIEDGWSGFARRRRDAVSRPRESDVMAEGIVIPAENGDPRDEVQTSSTARLALATSRREAVSAALSFDETGGLAMAECPVCAGEVELAGDTVEGELIECPECGSELEVLEVDPPRLGEAPEVEEDWGE